MSAYVVSRKQMDSVQEETLAVLATGIVVDNKHNRLLLLQRHRHRLREEDLRKALAPGETVLLEGSPKACKSYVEGNYTNPSCDYWHPPACQSYKSESGCKFGDTCLSEADRQLSKKSKKSGGKDRLLDEKGSEQQEQGCVSQDTEPPKKSIRRRSGQLGSHCTVKFSKGTWHHMKIRESKGVSLKNAIRVRQNLRIGHSRKPCNKNDAPAEKHGI